MLTGSPSRRRSLSRGRNVGDDPAHGLSRISRTVASSCLTLRGFPEYRWVEANAAQLPELAADLVRRKPDLIATYGSFFTGALTAATSSIPIVFTAHADPVGTGHSTSLARSGGRQQEPEGQPNLHHVHQSLHESHRPEFQLDGNAIDLHRGARCEQALSLAADETGHVDAHAAAVHLEDEGAPNHPLDFPDELDPSLIRAGDHERRRRFDRGRGSGALCGGRR